MILNLGCGLKKKEGWVNADINPSAGPDVLMDMDAAHLPFRDNVFHQVICDNVIEHLGDVLGVMEEIHRVCSHRAVVEIYTPHFSSDDAYTDITHRHYFGYRSFHIFEEGKSQFHYYTKAKYRILWTRIHFGRLWRGAGIEYLANKFPSFYESHWAFIFRAHQLSLHLEVLK
ncbi:MAG: methyltransferase domain-containing protein [bacterium]